MSAVLMVQGTSSDAGKSALVTALCRVLARRKVCVAPFKPQNMALNSAVTADGSEIGRAQAVQAQAARVAPHVDMNPVLLKPNSDIGAQVIVHGRAIGNMDAVHYHAYKTQAHQAVMAAYVRLCKSYDCIIVEGAGSPAEINLRDRDIANMGFAEAVDCPVILVADIDRGGVFAQLVGTLALLSESEQARVKGFVINRFRGDLSLLEPGIEWLTKKTGKPVFGVLPFLHGLTLPAEDALLPDVHMPASGSTSRLRVIVPVLPRISNHTDFDILRIHPDVDISFIRPDDAIPPADLIILPGTKSVRDDLAWLKSAGWVTAIEKHLRYGGRLLGICGGFQMLGQEIDDPEGIEGDPGKSVGLGLMDMHTRLASHKQLRNVHGQLQIDDTLAAISGYEIHAGVSTGAALDRPLCRLALDNHKVPEGAISGDMQVIGTYLHGLFDRPSACAALLRWAGLEQMQTPSDMYEGCEAAINALADAAEEHLDCASIFNLLGLADLSAQQVSL